MKAFMTTRKRVVENDLRLKRHNIIREMMKINSSSPNSHRSYELDVKHNHSQLGVYMENCDACKKVTPEIIVIHKGERIASSPLGSMPVPVETLNKDNLNNSYAST